MNWKIGQKLVYIGDTEYFPFCTTPQKNETITFDGSDRIGFALIKEYVGNAAIYGVRYAINPMWLRPLFGESAVSELLNMVTVKETSDCPIEVPQTETV